ncbi:MAG TPA: mechanosensitive ion channel [Candidatus Dormibacteraeota bacterium]|nr:mechanosensitive ion channel [Candidatus Dormibacteraeota bacterium]
MNLAAIASSLQVALETHLPSILAALGILIVGWLAAVAIRVGVRRLLGLVRLNTRIAEQTERKFDAESGVAKVAFWLIILVTLIGVFNSLDLPRLSGPFERLVEQVAAYLPRLVAGTMLVLLAWLAATALRGIANKALEASGLDERLSTEAGMAPMRRSIGDMLFWLVILLFLPAILGAYELTGLLDPVKSMVDKVLDMLPNVFAAFVIGFVGWLVGKVLSELVTNVLAAAGVDRAGGRLGLEESVQLSRIAGTVVLIFVFVPALIAALDALKIEAISRPATDMLDTLLAAVPNIFAAALILTITYYVAKFAAGLLSQLMVSLGADDLPEKLGLAHLFSGRMQPSRLVAAIVLFFAMLFATVEAANRLGFHQVRDVVTMFIQFGGNVLIGGAILVIGFWLADLAYQVITRAAGKGQAGLARIAHLAILGLVIAMGLRAMGIADDIVNLAFALTFGAVAVAIALSFGLGGREAAGRQMEYWLSKLRKEN